MDYKSIALTKQIGRYMHFRAVRYSDGSMYYWCAGHWYQPIGADHLFVPD